VQDSKYVRERIEKNKIIDIDKYKNISNECKDFIKSILTNDIDLRPGIDNIIMHEFINYDK